MSFRFNFNEDDDQFDNGHDHIDAHLRDAAAVSNLPSSSQGAHEPPASVLHTLEDLLCWLPDSISYENIQVLASSIAKRTFSDVMLQLMSGFSPCTAETQEEEDFRKEAETTVLDCLRDRDLLAGVYEGGLNTWECSLDLSRLLSTHPLPSCSLNNDSSGRNLETDTNTTQAGFKVVELGCGSALPSALFLARLLQDRSLRPGSLRPCAHQPVTLIIQDYNVCVLRYMTIANLFLAWYVIAASNKSASSERPPTTNGRHQVDEQVSEVEVTQEMKCEFVQALRDSNITLTGISGSWSEDMARLVGHDQDVDFIFSSDTIYSSASLPSLCNLLQRCIKPEGGLALVVAKRYYFGVGGGVEEFVSNMTPSGMEIERDNIETQNGVQRVILAIRHGQA